MVVVVLLVVFVVVVDPDLGKLQAGRREGCYGMKVDSHIWFSPSEFWSSVLRSKDRLNLT